MRLTIIINSKSQLAILTSNLCFQCLVCVLRKHLICMYVYHSISDKAVSVVMYGERLPVRLQLWQDARRLTLHCQR